MGFLTKTERLQYKVAVMMMLFPHQCCQSYLAKVSLLSEFATGVSFVHFKIL